MPSSEYRLGGGRAVITLNDGTVIEANVRGAKIVQEEFSIISGAILDNTVTIELNCGEANVRRDMDQSRPCRHEDQNCFHQTNFKHKTSHEIVAVCTVPSGRDCPHDKQLLEKIDKVAKEPEDEKTLLIWELKAVVWTLLKHIGGMIEYNKEDLRKITQARREVRTEVITSSGSSSVRLRATGADMEEYTIRVLSKKAEAGASKTRMLRLERSSEDVLQREEPDTADKD